MLEYKEYENTRIREYENTRIQKYKNTRVRKYKNTRIRKYENKGSEKKKKERISYSFNLEFLADIISFPLRIYNEPSKSAFDTHVQRVNFVYSRGLLAT